MPGYRAVCALADLPPGAARLVVVDGKEIALFHVDGAIRAIEDNCLHAGGPLHEGTVERGIVTCPWHQWEFDLTDGSCPLNPKVALRTYPTRVRDGRIELEFQG